MNLIDASRNISLTAWTVAEHLGEDPLMFGVQASRRLPTISRLVAEKALPLINSGSSLLPLAKHIAGDQRGAEERLAQMLDKGVSGRKARRLADISLTINLPDLAHAFAMDAGTTTPGVKGLRARMNWYHGEMTAAIECLQDGSRSERRHQQRLTSESAVFTGWRPFLRPVTGYVPSRRSVLHILTNSLPHTGSGYAQRSHSLIRAQADAGWKVSAVTRLGYPVQVGQIRASRMDTVDGVDYYRLLPARLPRGLQARLQLQAEKTLRLALHLRPSIIHTTTHFVNALVAECVADALGIPWVYEVRGQLADTWASNRPAAAARSERYKLFRDRENGAVQRASAVVSLSESMQRDVLALGVLPKNSALVPNSIGESFLLDPCDSPQARAKLGLPSAGIFIGTVSSLVDYEGLDDLIRAFALIVDDYEHLKCLIVGDGASLPRLRGLARELGVETKVLFPGRVDRNQSHVFHQALDVFVVPRKDLTVTRQVTPLKPVEALASSRPVIFSDLPALNEVVLSGREGLSVPAGNPEKLAAAIRYLVDNPDLRKRMGVHGRTRVLEERTWTAAAAATTALYFAIRVKD
jgi:glycosyltransferase involved in cell wall biosynthesis